MTGKVAMGDDEIMNIACHALAGVWWPLHLRADALVEAQRHLSKFHKRFSIPLCIEKRLFRIKH